VRGLSSSGDFFSALGSALEQAGQKADSPWLTAQASDLLGSARAAESSRAAEPGRDSWTPVAADGAAGPGMAAAPSPEVFEAYPECLRPSMRAARALAFVGTMAELPPLKGAVRAFNLRGDLHPVADQDLIILRVTPDMLDGLSERLANLRRQARGLKKMLVVFNGNDARRTPLAQGEWLARPDLTAEGMTVALTRAGFAVKGTRPYDGFAAETAAPLINWSLMEAAPRSNEYALQKKVSIIILGFNQVEYTKKCIETIREHTKQAYELILVDNGSHDGTEAFFRSVPGAKVIRNAENLGVSKGWNQGMRIATGEYLLILNNDIIVGPGWLENMVRLAESDAAIGMVGPRSNYIAGPQIVPAVPYKKIEDIQPFIKKWQKENELSCEEWGFIKGFSLLIPRRVFDKVGFFDERFGKGNFEDDDYCLRVRYHGFKTSIAHDSFIHHFGSVSFNQESVDWKALMIENKRKYEEKWAKGPSAIHDTIVSGPAPSGAVAPSGAAAQVGTLAPRPGTSEIQEAQRAYERGDLAVARKLYLAAQDRNPSDPETYCGLGAVLFGEGALEDAATLFLRCLEMDPTHADAARNLLDCMEAKQGSVSEADRASLARRFPRNSAWNQGVAPIAAAPQTAPVIPKAETPRAETAPEPWRVEIEDAIGREDYNAAMNGLERRLKSGLDQGACFSYFGIVASQCGDHALALEHFNRALRLGAADADLVFNLADTYLLLGRAGEALKLLENLPAMDARETERGEFSAMIEQIRHAISSGPVDAGKLIDSRERNLLGEKLLRLGEPETARENFQAMLGLDPADFRALNNLGLAEWYLGDSEAAWKSFSACLAIRPAWSDALVNAFDCALALGRIEAMDNLLDRAQAIEPRHRDAERMRAHIAREGQAVYANGGFEALQKDAEILERAEKSLDEGRLGEAILLYLDAMQRRPRNPQALNGLGVIAFKENRLVDAYALFDAAAALHPLDEDILLNLWQGAQALKRENDVLPRLRTSLERDPSMQDVKLIIKEFA
jgi:GT2 family glycosyltransferase/tetratricopeptide (TPR) repeat protein